jgi:AraC-like DNA-binding protein
MARYIQKYLESIATQPNVTASDKVREFVWMLLPSGRCSVELIAEQMGVDRRTIHRRLGHEGNTFTSIVEGVRTDNAVRYLEDPNRPLHLIAEALGFSALSAFSRWFRTRYGCSASEWRAGAFNTTRNDLAPPGDAS